MLCCWKSSSPQNNSFFLLMNPPRRLTTFNGVHYISSTAILIALSRCTLETMDKVLRQHKHKRCLPLPVTWRPVRPAGIPSVIKHVSIRHTLDSSRPRSRRVVIIKSFFFFFHCCFAARKNCTAENKEEHILKERAFIKIIFVFIRISKTSLEYKQIERIILYLPIVIS